MASAISTSIPLREQENPICRELFSLAAGGFRPAKSERDEFRASLALVAKNEEVVDILSRLADACHEPAVLLETVGELLETTFGYDPARSGMDVWHELDHFGNRKHFARLDIPARKLRSLESMERSA